GTGEEQVASRRTGNVPAWDETHLIFARATTLTVRSRAGASQTLQIRDEVIQLGGGQLAEGRDILSAMRSRESSAQRLGTAVVQKGILVIHPAQRRGIISTVSVVRLLQPNFVDLAVGKLGSGVAGVARSLGGSKHTLAALRRRRQTASRFAERIPRIVE